MLIILAKKVSELVKYGPTISNEDARSSHKIA